MATVTVIVPVFNIVEYLQRCVESILSQTFKDFELLLIDDGSTDGSSNLCDALAKRDCRIKVFHKINEGVGSARNLGIELSSGKWIAFIDGDDLVVSEYLENMLTAVETDKTDIVCCNLTIHNIDNVITQYPFKLNQRCKSEIIQRNFFTDQVIKTQFYGPYNKLIRKDIIGALRFKELAVCEDILFIFELLLKACEIQIVPFLGYYYIKHKGSATTSSFNSKKLDYVKAAHIIDGLAVKVSDEVADKAHVWTLNHSIITLRQIYKNKLEHEFKGFLDEERDFIASNSASVKRLGPMRRIDYFLLSYCPFLYRFLPI